MADNSNSIYRFIQRRPLLFLGICILIFYLAFAGTLTAVTFKGTPNDLQTITGTISSFKHHDRTNPDILDYLAEDTSSCFDVKFADGSSFRLNGYRYNNVDCELFSKIVVGTEMTVTYDEQGWGGGIDLIYGIEYNGKTYLDTEKSIEGFWVERKSMTTTYIILMAILTALAGGAYVAAYVAIRRKRKMHITK